MASPVDAGRVATNISTAATSHNINVGSPSAGDILLVIIRVAAASGGVGGQINAWDFLGLFTGDATDDETFIYAKVATGSEGATQTFTTANSSKLAAICWRITGTIGVPSAPTEATFTTTANTANPPSASVSGGPLDVLYLALMGLGGEANAPSAAPTNYSNLITANSGTGGAVATNCSVGGATRAISASNSDDPGVFTHAAASSGGNAFTLVFYPIPPPNPPFVGRPMGAGVTY